MRSTEQLLKSIVGQFVENVYIDKGSDSATLILGNGRELTFSLEGDCCSHSYFRDIDEFKELMMTHVLVAEEGSDGPLPTKTWDEDGTDQLSYHCLKFTTNKGHLTIDWRNDSNGYYGGWLEISTKPLRRQQ